MELVDRYLHAVRGYLPSAQQEDIIAELKDSLLSGIEAREAELGRELTDTEQQAIIKQTGHPMIVASRYMPRQYLIGPGMFPFWWAGLRIMLTVVGLVYVILAGIGTVTSGKPIQAVIQAMHGFAGTALFYAAVITLMFSLFERHQIRFGFLDRWQPAQLAAIRDRLQIKRGESLFELVAGVLFTLWWCGTISFATAFFHHGKAVPLALSQAWEPYWWGILALALAGIGLSVVNLITPYWKWDRLLLRILLNVIAIGLAYTLFAQDGLSVVGDAGVEIGRHGSAEKLLNQLMHGLLAVLALAWAVQIFQDIRRLLQR